MIKFFKSKWSYIVYFIIIIIIILYEAQGKGDFNIFLSASRDLMLKKNIYKTLYNDWYHYYYDVSFALFLFPFTFFPLYLVKIFWLLLNVFFVFRIWVNIKNLVQISLLKKKNQNIFIILSFIFIFSFIRDNFHLSQLTIFILFSILEGLNLIDKNNKIAGSFLISLGISIKLLPIVIIPYLIYRNQLKPVIYIILFILLLLFIPALFIGYDYNNYLLIERWSLINPINQKHILDTSERSFHSLTTLLSTLLVEDCGDLHALPLKRNIANLSIEKLNLIINIIRGVLVLSTLYFLNTKPFKSVRNNIQKLYEIGYICLLIPLIFPHQQFYAFFLIFSIFFSICSFRSASVLSSSVFLSTSSVTSVISIKNLTYKSGVGSSSFSDSSSEINSAKII